MYSLLNKVTPSHCWVRASIGCFAGPRSHDKVFWDPVWLPCSIRDLLVWIHCNPWVVEVWVLNTLYLRTRVHTDETTYTGTWVHKKVVNIKTLPNYARVHRFSERWVWSWGVNVICTQDCSFSARSRSLRSCMVSVPSAGMYVIYCWMHFTRFS